jgi:hypothetical protein
MERRYRELLVRRKEAKGKGVLAALNGMVTVLGIENGPSQIPPNIGVGQENGKGME